MPRPISARLCQECRRRKQKCDEKRPACSLCSKLGLACVYPHIERFVSTFATFQRTPSPGTSKEILLNLRKTQRLGTSIYQVFTPPREPKQHRKTVKKDGHRPEADLSLLLSPSPTDADNLADKLVALLTADDLIGTCLWMLGDWPHFVPRAIGHSPLLDHAVKSMLLGSQGAKMRDETTIRKAFIEYGMAVALLRDAVRKGTVGITADLLAAMKMLECFEVTVGVSMASYIAHCRGAVQCFISKGPDFLEDEFARSLYYATYGAAANQIHDPTVRDVFETAEWRQTDMAIQPLTGPLDFGGKRRRAVTLLPRFIGLVRHVCQNTHDLAAIEQTRIFVEEFLHLDWIQKARIPLNASIHPTGDSSAAMPFKLEFSRKQDALASIVHMGSKAVTAGLFQRLHNYKLLADILPSLSVIHNEEYQAALIACMSLPEDLFDTAAENNFGIHSVAAVLLPLQSVWGALWRTLCRVKVYQQHDEVERLTTLLQWLLERCNMLANALGHNVTWDYLVGYTIALQGGTMESLNSPTTPPDLSTPHFAQELAIS